jgi:hypothetical protein
VKAHYQLLGKPEGRLPPLKPALLFGVFVIVWRGGALALAIRQAINYQRRVIETS